MKKLFFVLSVFCLFTIGSANARNHIVNVQVLNLRSCAGTNCDIVGRLNKGEVVYVESHHGEWVKVQTDRRTGFVIKNSLSADNSIAEDIGIVLLIMLGISIGLLILFAPSIVARNNKNANKIFWVNLLLFWIPFVWLVLLIAAILGESKETK